MVTKEIDKASVLHKKLKQQNEEYRVPEVLDYVHLKVELYELDKKVQDWERKVPPAFRLLFLTLSLFISLLLVTFKKISRGTLGL
jgi:Domain of unknown function (DUF4201)